MKYISKENIVNKNVLVRCDFNVPIKNNRITDDSKIKKSLKTINYLLENNNRVILFSHFGRVKTNEDKENNSLRLVFQELKKYLNIVFIENNENIEFYLNNSKSNCFLVENTRFTDIPVKRESKNDLELAKYWASFGDIFVLDAFASMHRVHSSTSGIGAFLPTYIGFLVEEEIENLKEIVDIKNNHFVVIMGGAKVDDKILIINDLVKKCDYLILTGGILNTFLKVTGKNVGKSLISEDEDVLKSVKNILDNYCEKLIFNNRFVVFNNENIQEKCIEEVCDEDIIYDNIVDINNIVTSDTIVFLNGTCGKFEEEKYENGTKLLLNNLKNSQAKIYVGGGDTVSAVTKYGYEKDFVYLSSGGGATLEYVSTGKINALEWIKENGVEK